MVTNIYLDSVVEENGEEHIERQNYWNFGNPTEEGDYVVQIGTLHEGFDYHFAKYSVNFGWIFRDCDAVSVVKWHKIPA